MPALMTLMQDFVSLFYPNYCVGCYNTLVKGEEYICTRCLIEMPVSNYHLDEDNPLRRRLYGRVPVRHGLAYCKFSKSGRIQQVLHSLKYKNQPEVGVVLGRAYGATLEPLRAAQGFELVVPVPLHESRLRKRGYNQSAMFAQGLAEIARIPLAEEVVSRVRVTETQTRKSKLDRWSNVADVFQVVKPELLAGKHVLLVDDVITTGATIEACGQTLLRAGCGGLSVACIAVA